MYSGAGVSGKESLEGRVLPEGRDSVVLSKGLLQSIVFRFHPSTIPLIDVPLLPYGRFIPGE
jgi:hypothetical protein